MVKKQQYSDLEPIPWLNIYSFTTFSKRKSKYIENFRTQNIKSLSLLFIIFYYFFDNTCRLHKLIAQKVQKIIIISNHHVLSGKSDKIQRFKTCICWRDISLNLRSTVCIATKPNLSLIQLLLKFKRNIYKSEYTNTKTDIYKFTLFTKHNACKIAKK